jgi:hypothetical protein
LLAWLEEFVGAGCSRAAIRIITAVLVTTVLVTTETSSAGQSRVVTDLAEAEVVGRWKAFGRTSTGKVAGFIGLALSVRNKVTGDKIVDDETSSP